jgi:hypothetical protein
MGRRVTVGTAWSGEARAGEAGAGWCGWVGFAQSWPLPCGGLAARRGRALVAQGKSTSLLKKVSQVRILPGAPTNTALISGFRRRPQPPEQWLQGSATPARSRRRALRVTSGLTVTFFTRAGTVGIIADLSGSYSLGRGDAFTGQAPVRALDTRDPNRRGAGRTGSRGRGHADHRGPAGRRDVRGRPSSGHELPVRVDDPVPGMSCLLVVPCRR